MHRPVSHKVFISKSPDSDFLVSSKSRTPEKMRNSIQTPQIMYALFTGSTPTRVTPGRRVHEMPKKQRRLERGATLATTQHLLIPDAMSAGTSDAFLDASASHHSLDRSNNAAEHSPSQHPSPPSFFLSDLSSRPHRASRSHTREHGRSDTSRLTPGTR